MKINLDLHPGTETLMCSDFVTESPPTLEVAHTIYPLPELAWPPQYAVRLSTRAKRITVQISPKRGLELVLPKRKRPPPAAQIASVLEEHQTWIKKHLAVWHKEQTRRQQQPIWPDTLSFPALNKEIFLEYQKTDSLQLRIKYIRSIKNTCILSGAILDATKVTAALKKILYKEAYSYLIPWLNRLSLATGLPYTEASIRSQTSLWGSCTTARKISLNAKLLFLPKELIEYVLLHELCHTKHMNHSLRFWNLVKQFDPNCLAHRRALRHSSVYLPRWIDS